MQPRHGARANIDTVLMAAAVPAAAGERVIEAGSGSGAAALCVAVRCPETSVTGVEIEAELVELAHRNAALGGLDGQVRFLAACVTTRPPALGRGQFDHALANPPYFEAATAVASPAGARARAFVGREATLADWTEFCLDMVRPKGSVTFIHRADRLDALLALLHGRAGEIALFPLWPREGVPAKRVLVQARKAMKGAALMLPGLVLHDARGRFTEAAQRVLRDALPLDLRRSTWQPSTKSRKRR